MSRSKESSAVRRWSRPLRLAVLLLAALELAYVVGANTFLNSAWGKARLNRRPDKLSMQWRSAWTFLPGLVSIDELELQGRARRATWRLELGSGRLFIWLPSLFSRHLRLFSGAAQGGSVEVDVTPPPESPRPEHRRRGWRISIDRLDLADLTRFRVDRYSLEGAGTVRGNASFEVRGPMRFDLAELSFHQARLLAGDQVAADSLSLDSSLDVDEVSIGELTVADLLAGTSGELALVAEASSLGFLAAYLGRFPWIELGGSGHLTVDLEVTDGWLAPGSELTFEGPEVSASYLGLRAHGVGTVRGSVPEGASHVRLAAELDSFEVDRRADELPLLTGEGLSVVVTNDSTAIDRPAEGISVAMKLPPARVGNLGDLDVYIPESAGIVLSGGEAEISAELSYSASDDNGDGWLRFSGERIVAGFDESTFQADVRLDARFPEVRLAAGTLAIDGSRLEIDGVRVARDGRMEESEWWGIVEVPSGTLSREFGAEIAQPAVIEGDLDADLLDTMPLTAVIRDRVPKLGWLDGVLTVQDVDLASGFRLSGPDVRLEGLQITGGAKDRLEIQAELDLKRQRVDGVLLAVWGPLSAAVVLDDNARDWKLTRSRAWYAEQAEAYRDGSAADPPP